MLTIPLCVTTVQLTSGFVAVTAQGMLVGLFGSVVIILVNYSCMTWTSKTVSPSVTASSMMLQPVLTFVYSSLFEGGARGVTLYEVFGAIVIVIGLLCSLWFGRSGENRANNSLISSSSDSDDLNSDVESSGGSGAKKPSSSSSHRSGYSAIQLRDFISTGSKSHDNNADESILSAFDDLSTHSQRAYHSLSLNDVQRHAQQKSSGEQREHQWTIVTDDE
eukprot:gene22520-28653_t